MILNDDGTYDSMSEDEMEAIEQVAMQRRVNEDEDDQVLCDEDTSPALIVSKVLTLQHQQEEDQRCHIDKDMTTLDMTKNIAYMHICQVISSANYSIIYLCYPEQKYSTHFCVFSNCRCMEHLYNPHMKGKGEV